MKKKITKAECFEFRPKDRDYNKKDVVDISPTITTMSAQFIDKKTSIVVFEVTENGK